MKGTNEDLLSDFTDEERFLFRKAVSRLSLHDDTPRRLCERLGKLSFEKEPVSPEACRKVVRFLHAQGLLNERRYADDLVSALKSRGYGKRRILNELYTRRFSRATLARIAEELDREAMEDARAYEMLSRRAAARNSDLRDANERARLYGYLARLGFSSEIAAGALEKLQEEMDG